MIKDWEDLEYWTTGEWQVIEERLSDMDIARKKYYPKREDLFKALDLCPFKDTKAIVVGQDPYTDSDLATGLAFSIPPNTKFPLTLQNIFKEYSDDLALPIPAHGDLTKWAKQGVLLWNVNPSVGDFPLSHHWPEWWVLTQEIIDNLKEKGIVFVFLGSVAREWAEEVHTEQNCRVIETSHPSPRGNINSKNPFLGSRMFSRTNDYLCELGLGPVDWRL